MPELPEVEIAKRQLKAKLKNFRVASAVNFVKDDGTPYKLRKAVPSVKALEGQTFTKIVRRGKYIIMSFEKHHLVCHFGMTGMLYVTDKRSLKSLNTKHEIVRLTSTQGQNLSYTDARRFGLIEVVAWDKLNDYLETLNLGVEPLPDAFLKCDIKVLLKQYSKRPLKDWLLDQSIIAGIGNIYASEICFSLKLHPLEPAGKSVVLLKSGMLKRVVQNMLRKAVSLGGSTIRSYESPDGTKGAAQSMHKVYGKEGGSCVRCNSTILASTIKGRNTFYCPTCQKLSP